MRVVIAATSFHPQYGSESGVGWMWANAAAERHDVTILTTPWFRSDIEEELVSRPNPRLRVEYITMPTARWSTSRAVVSRLHYVSWQRRVRRRIRELHALAPFDVAHHLTYAIDWLPAGAVGIPGLPSVWGPVGGTAPLPWRGVRWLGMRGAVSELSRTLVSSPARRLWGDRMARRAMVTVVQNDEVATRFRRHGPIVEPNVAIDLRMVQGPHVVAGETEPVTARRVGEDVAAHAIGTRAPVRTALMVGRLEAFKGVAAMVDALARPELAGWRLVVLGDGPERERLLRRARRRGVEDRVVLRGQVPRSEVFSELTTADALVSASMHEAGGWAVAEAIAVGCPVVAIDIGGPALLLRRCGGGRLVALSGDMPQHLSTALTTVGPAPETSPVDSARLADLVDGWYRMARQRAGLVVTP